MEKTKVGILGATGTVGQQFVRMLDGHPWFEVTALAASEQSSGKTYEEAVEGRWKLSTPIPDYARKMKVQDCKPNLNCRLVFGALDASVAGAIEQDFAQRGYVVSSNSRNHRMFPNVPLVIAEVNPEHLEAIKQQPYKGGCIVTNPNCSTVGLAMALAPIHKKFGVEKCIVTTMQAISGAGYPGVASLDIVDNVLPYIGMEEEKMESETLKILGNFDGKKFDYAKIVVSASCNRVATVHGHMESVSVKLAENASEADLTKCFSDFNPLKELKLPTSPTKPIVVHSANDRPQPKLDRMLGNGMSVSIGRLRKCNVLDWKFTVLVHNTIRGAAGAAILNAELMKARGLL